MQKIFVRIYGVKNTCQLADMCMKIEHDKASQCSEGTHRIRKFVAQLKSSVTVCLYVREFWSHFWVSPAKHRLRQKRRDICL